MATVNDSTDESDGSIRVNIASGTDYTVAAPPNDMASVTVQDNDDPPVRSIGACVSAAKWNTVAGYYASNAERAPKYGANWYRVLIAYSQERTDKTIPEWDGTTSKPTTPYTAAEAEESEKIWGGWTPVRKTLECLEKASTPSQQSTQQEVSPPAISLTAGAAVTEGGNAVFTVHANPAPAANLLVTLNIGDDPTSDFLYTGDEGSQTVVIQANQVSATLTIAGTSPMGACLPW